MSQERMSPIFLDIEASSWTFNSFPIEIAWGSTTDNIQSYLINPQEIQEWTDWSTNAEKAHGISRELLTSQGISPYEMCELLKKNLDGKTVYTDAPDYDGMWLFNLFKGCEIDPSPIDLRSFDELMISTFSKEIDTRLFDLKEILRFKSRAKDRGKQHRASWDVEYLVTTWKMTKES